MLRFFYLPLDHIAPRGDTDHVTGMELRLKRVAADVKAREIAETMGVSPQAVSHWERSRLVSENVGERYLAALATITTKTTSPVVVVGRGEAA